MTGWEQEGGRDELRFVLWGVPHVIKRQEQYLVCLQGLPPQRRLMHLAVLPKGAGGDSPDEVVAWVKRSGIFGLMSKTDAEILSQRVREWWAGPPMIEPAAPAPVDPNP
jgi:hypothetical protein